MKRSAVHAICIDTFLLKIRLKLISCNNRILQAHRAADLSRAQQALSPVSKPHGEFHTIGASATDQITFTSDFLYCEVRRVENDARLTVWFVAVAEQ